MSAKNKVIAGDYKGKMVMASFGKVMLSISFLKSIELNKDNIADYEVMDESHRKSATL